jgi:recombination protein RecT
MATAQIATRPADTGALTKKLLATEAYKARFEEVLGSRAPQFMASIVSAAGSYELQGCDPDAIIKETLKAAVLDFPIEKSLGFAFIIAYKKNNKPVPQFQLGWKGVVQLAMRTGMYERLNARMVNAEAFLGYDQAIGEPIIDWKNIDETKDPVGFAVVWKLRTGFIKVGYWTKEKCIDHAKRYSKSYQYDLRDHKQSSLWSTNPNAMCLKTVIMNELRRWGILSVEMRQAFDADEGRVDLSAGPAIEMEPIKHITEDQRVALVSLKQTAECPDEEYTKILAAFGCVVTADIAEVGGWNGGELLGDQDKQPEGLPETQDGATAAEAFSPTQQAWACGPKRQAVIQQLRAQLEQRGYDELKLDDVLEVETDTRAAKSLTESQADRYIKKLESIAKGKPKGK